MGPVPMKGRNSKLAFEAAMANLPKFLQAEVVEATALEELDMTCATAVPVEKPRLYQIETTSRCNLDCPFCPRTIELKAHKQRDLNAIMALDDFEHVLDKMPWLESLELFHFGEPFMHKDFERYVAACTRRGIYSVIASNLLPATPAKIDAVFDAGLGFLVMDVDSLDAERYAQMRVNGDLDRLREIVCYILAKPEERRPYCVAQTIMIGNEPEYTEEQFTEWTGGLRAEEVRYKFLDSFRNTVCDKGILGPNDLCREAFYGFTVHVNGNVVPCDRDWSGQNVMGNIFTEGVMDIWEGKRFKEFRSRMCSDDKPEMCKNCSEGRLINFRSQPMIQVNMFRGAEVEHV